MSHDEGSARDWHGGCESSDSTRIWSLTMWFPSSPVPVEEPVPFPTWDAKDLDEFLRELRQGDQLLELEDFFPFAEQDLDA